MIESTTGEAMGENSQNSGIQRLLELGVSGTALVVLMGLPAMVVYYANHNIPIALLSYRRVLEAGAIPALLTGLLVSYFVWATRGRRGRSDKRSIITDVFEERPSLRLLSVSFPALPMLLPAFGIALAGLIAVCVWPIWALGYIVVEAATWFVLDHELSNPLKTLIGFVTFATIVLFVISIRRSKAGDRSSSTAAGSPNEAAQKKQISQSDLGWIGLVLYPRTLDVAIYGSLLLYALIPPEVIGATYFVGFTLSTLLSLDLPRTLTHEVVIVAGLGMGIPYAHFISAANIASFATSSTESVRQRAHIALAITYGTFVATCVIVYSVYVFPVLPRAFGGGLPDVINITVRADAMLPNSAEKLKLENVTEILDAQLIDRNDNDTIFCKQNEKYRVCFSLPTDSISGLNWQSAATP